MNVAIIGAGPAGCEAAFRLAEEGIQVDLIEKENVTGGNLNNWYQLFPDRKYAGELNAILRNQLNHPQIRLHLNTEAVRMERKGKGKFAVQLSDHSLLECDALLVTTGFKLFDAQRKEEYGYGIYDNVFTTVDVERMFREGGVRTADGREPRTVAFLHCVGSRDEKVEQRHCSRVCCITGVKQAIETKRLFPEADIFNFYMDIRMFGPGYEELYREAQQQYGIHFVRGRISEAAPTHDNRLQIKAEDTLTGRPLRMSVDLLVLLVGMRANDENAAWAVKTGLNRAASGFLQPQDLFLHNVQSGVEGIFYAGAVTAPKTIGETVNEATAAANAVANYLAKA